MKKLGFVYIVSFSLMLLSACGNATFNGSSTGNDTQFIMEYSILNTSDHRKLSLEMGDVIDTTVVSDAGSVDIQVENSVGESIYSEKDVPTSEFEIVISQNDTYTFTVTGHSAKGGVSFIHCALDCITDACDCCRIQKTFRR